MALIIFGYENKKEQMRGAPIFEKSDLLIPILADTDDFQTFGEVN